MVAQLRADGHTMSVLGRRGLLIRLTHKCNKLCSRFYFCQIFFNVLPFLNFFSMFFLVFFRKRLLIILSVIISPDPRTSKNISETKEAN